MDIINELKRQSLLQYIGGQNERIGGGLYRSNPCPLCGHNDCFTIYENTNTYKCFSCGKSGSIIDFIIDKGDAWDVKAAIDSLCKHFNIVMPEKRDWSDGAAGMGIKRERIQAIFNRAADYYHEQLMKSKVAVKYLKDRRKRAEWLWKELKYGYAASRSGLTAGLTALKYSEEEQIASGLVKKDEKDGHLYDLFGNGVIVYPGYLGKDVVDFSCKPLDKEKGSAYQLPSRYKLRGCLFYGQEALYNKQVILVEGQEDRNAILEAGNYGVAAMIGQISDAQLSFIKDKCEGKEVFLCFDRDSAGRKYAYKVGEVLAGKAYVRMIGIPEPYNDVDEWLRELPEKDKKGIWDDALVNAEDIIIHLLSSLPDDIAEITPYLSKLQIEPIIKLIAKEDESITRNRYISQMSVKLGGKTEWASAIKSSVRKIREGIEDEDMPGSSTERSIQKKGHQYFKITKDSYKPISEFIIDINRYIEVEGIRHYEVTLVSSMGLKSKPLKLSNEQRINMKQFDAALAGVGPYYFYGSLNDLKEVWQIEESEADIKSYTCIFRRYGYIKDHKVWLFKNCAYKNNHLYKPVKADEGIIEVDNIGYLSEDVRVYGGDYPELWLNDKPSEEYNRKVIQLMWDMWDAPESGGYPFKSFKGFLAMGYVAAVIYLREIAEKERKFPYILAYGPPGTGKSEAMQFIMNIFGFRNGGENWGEATSAGIGQAMDQLSSMPYCIEEFSNAVGASSFQQKKVELLKNMYNRVSSGKGGINSSRLVYEVNAAMLLIGQDRPENQALLSRCIVLRKEKPAERGNLAYYELKSKNKELSLVLRWLLETKTAEKVKEYWDNYSELMAHLKERIKKKTGDYNERTASNYAIFACGFKIYGYSDYDKEFVDWIVDECITDMNRKQAEDLVYKFIESIEVCFSENIKEVVKKAQNQVYIHFNLCYNEWIRNLKQTGMQEYIGREGLMDYLRKDPAGYWIEPDEKRGMHRKYIGNKQVRCIGMVIDLLPAHIQEVVESWDVPEETF